MLDLRGGSSGFLVEVRDMTAVEASPHAATVTAFLAVFPPNPSKHGRYWGLDAKGEKLADTAEGEAVTPDLILSHLTAPHGPLTRKRQLYAIGYLPGGPDGTTAGALDLDGKDYPDPGALDDAVQRVARAAGRLGFAVYLEKSSRGNGWHVWVFVAEPITHTVMRLLLRALRHEAGLSPSTETYPAGETHSSTWIATPYAGALNDPQRLGRTFLMTPEGQAIPVDKLDEWVAPMPAGLAGKLAQVEGERQPSYGNGKATDLAPEAADVLARLAVSKAPTRRHEAIGAFLNLGARAGRLADVADALKRAEVHRLWVQDGSRTLTEWGGEVDDWATWIASHPDTGGRGVKYLKDAGFNVATLPRPTVRVGQEPATEPPPLPVEEGDPSEPQADGPDFWTVTDPSGEAVRLVLPFPYAADSVGGVRLDSGEEGKAPRLIAPRALAVVGIGEDADTGESVALVRFQTSSGLTRERRVPLAALADGRELVKALAPFDAPVLASRGKAATEYLDALRTANRHVLPRSTFTARMGVRPGGIVGPGYSIGNVPTYAGEFGSRFRTGADTDAYPQALRAVLAWGPVAWPLWLALGLSAVGPMLHTFKTTRNPVLWFYGGSGTGKTTTVRFAGGLHLEPEGEPFTLQGLKATTPKGILQTLEHLGGYPVALEETHMARPEVLEAITYSFANGTSYTRGGRDGTPRHTPSLYGAAFLTGEAPPDFEHTGSRNRALMLDSGTYPPLGKLDAPERAELLERAWQAGAGQLGRRVLEAMWADRSQFGEALKAREADELRALGRKPGREWVRPLVAAELALAYVFEAAGIQADVPHLVGPALDALTKGRTAVDPVAEAMDALLALIAGTRSTDPESGEVTCRTQGRTFGRLDEGSGEWALIAKDAAVVAALKERGGLRAHGQAWVARGWVNGSGDSATRPKTFNGTEVRCIVLTPTAGRKA